MWNISPISSHFVRLANEPPCLVGSVIGLKYFFTLSVASGPTPLLALHRYSPLAALVTLWRVNTEPWLVKLCFTPDSNDMDLSPPWYLTKTNYYDETHINKSAHHMKNKVWRSSLCTALCRLIGQLDSLSSCSTVQHGASPCLAVQEMK